MDLSSDSMNQMLTKTVSKRKCDDFSDESDSTEIYLYFIPLSDSQEVVVKETLESIVRSIELSFDKMCENEFKDQNNGSIPVFQNDLIDNKSDLQLIEDLDLSEEFWNDFNIDSMESTNNLKTESSERQTSSLETDSIAVISSAEQITTSEQLSTPLKTNLITNDDNFKQNFQKLLNRMAINESKETSFQTGGPTEALKLLSELDSINDSISSLKKKFSKRVNRFHK